MSKRATRRADDHRSMRSNGALTTRSEDRTKALLAAEPQSSAGRLLAMSATYFRTHGFAATSTRDLAKALGIRSASLYHHIRHKEDLLYALSVDALERLTREVESGLEYVDDPLDRVRLLAQIHMTHTLADRDKHAAMLFELRCLTPARRAHVTRMRGAYERIVRDTIARAQRAGAIRRDITAKIAALALLNLLNWSIFWYRPGGGATPTKLAGLLTSIYLDGIATPKGQRRLARSRRR